MWKKRVRSSSKCLQKKNKLKEIAKLLYQTSEPENVQTLAGIEETIRAQTLEYISPQLGVFLSNKLQAQQKDDVGN